MPDFTNAIRRVNAAYAKSPLVRWPDVHDDQPCDKAAWEERRAGREGLWMREVVNTPREVVEVESPTTPDIAPARRRSPSRKSVKSSPLKKAAGQ